jgi:hypothetical protein
MPRRATGKRTSSYKQEELNFEKIISSATILSKEDASSKSRMGEANQNYDPVGQTTEYMRRAVQIEDAWETIIQKAREQLLMVDARQVYFDFLSDLKKQIEGGVSNSATLAKLMEAVAIRGLGMTRAHVRIDSPAKGSSRWRVALDADLVSRHLTEHIVGTYFLNPIELQDNPWASRMPIVAASDVSQHRSAVPVPARFFKRSVPFVLNNAAGTLFKFQDGQPKYDNVFNPRPDDALLRWMLIDPSYQDDLEMEDYERCIASAMDVGQYKFDLELLLKANKRSPDVIFRDGSLFPQDAYIDNFIIENKRGDFTREAIRDFLACLSYAREVGIVYCGVSKNVQLKVYSAIMDWYIARYINKD